MISFFNFVGVLLFSFEAAPYFVISIYFDCLYYRLAMTTRNDLETHFIFVYFQIFLCFEGNLCCSKFRKILCHAHSMFAENTFLCVPYKMLLLLCNEVLRLLYANGETEVLDDCMIISYTFPSESENQHDE
jgi:hypothetical protein